ncbi:MAG: hypothetical protein KY475_11455, partial [Planctomycetes bacterium]|nr:hypothetical protein [Planctomycetota bacterium]
DVETVLAYDASWNRRCFGWRSELHRSGLWLVGEEPAPVISPAIREDLDELNRRGLLRLRLLETRLALELHRGKFGQWPRRLHDLMPEYLPAVPGDPYADGPLVFRRRGDGFLLYSVGPDGRDDGGRLSSDRQDQALEGFDIDWEYDRRIQAEFWPRKKK